MDITNVLPVDCISKIISLTSPKDACRSSSVSSVFKTAEDSDNVWERFLPRDYEDMIAQSSSSQSFISSLNKKQIFFHLCDHPVLLNDGEMYIFSSLGIEKESGKKCCILGAKGLTIVWGDTRAYWQWISLPDSRFNEVAKLNYVWWLDIKARVKANNVLSPGTLYTAFFVYRLEGEHSMRDRFVEMSVINTERSLSGSHRRIILDPNSTNSMMRKRQRVGHKREDGWMEVEMADLFIDEHCYGGEGFTEFRLWETNGYIKDGLIVEGFEFRPKRL